MNIFEDLLSEYLNGNNKELWQNFLLLNSLRGNFNYMYKSAQFGGSDILIYENGYMHLDIFIDSKKVERFIVICDRFIDSNIIIDNDKDLVNALKKIISLVK